MENAEIAERVAAALVDLRLLRGTGQVAGPNDGVVATLWEVPVFLIRRAKSEDVDTLVKLAKMVHFINLPADREIIGDKVTWSRTCFLLAADEDAAESRSPKKGKRKAVKKGSASEHGEISDGLAGLTGRSPLFMFVLEDLESGGVIGTSQIIARMGGPGQPNLSLQLSRREMWSQSLQMGVTHTVAKLHKDETGPTEIGGLILQPSFRGHKLRLGRFIAIVRFHFMALHRHMFSDRVLAEMMGAITADGESPFWDHCTRCFINLTYDEADRFCQNSKEFILSLFPSEDIYLTLLAPEARAVIGTVGPETLPARMMLEKLGFKSHNRVDPFDGGPHLEADMDSISLVRETKRVRFAEPVTPAAAANFKRMAIVSTLDDDGEFKALHTSCDLDRAGRVVLGRPAFEALVATVGDEAGFTLTSSSPAVPAAAAKKRRSKRA